MIQPSQKVAVIHNAALRGGLFHNDSSVYQFLICLYSSCQGFFLTFNAASPGGCHIKTKALFLFSVGQGRPKRVLSGKTRLARHRPSGLHAQLFTAAVLSFSFHQTSWCNQSDDCEHCTFVTKHSNVFPTQGHDQFAVTRSTSYWGIKLCESKEREASRQKCNRSALLAYKIGSKYCLGSLLSLKC